MRVAAVVEEVAGVVAAPVAASDRIKIVGRGRLVVVEKSLEKK